MEADRIAQEAEDARLAQIEADRIAEEQARIDAIEDE